MQPGASRNGKRLAIFMNSRFPPRCHHTSAGTDELPDFDLFGSNLAPRRQKRTCRIRDLRIGRLHHVPDFRSSRHSRPRRRGKERGAEPNRRTYRRREHLNGSTPKTDVSEKNSCPRKVALLCTAVVDHGRNERSTTTRDRRRPDKDTPPKTRCQDPAVKNDRRSAENDDSVHEFATKIRISH